MIPKKRFSRLLGDVRGVGFAGFFATGCRAVAPSVVNGLWRLGFRFPASEHQAHPSSATGWVSPDPSAIVGLTIPGVRVDQRIPKFVSACHLHSLPLHTRGLLLLASDLALNRRPRV